MSEEKEIVPQIVNIPFTCTLKQNGRKTDQWDGKIKSVTNFGSHIQIHINSRSGFSAIVGPYISGYFLAIPADQTVLELSAITSDLSYNIGKVFEATGEGKPLNLIDGISAVYAFDALNKGGLLPERPYVDTFRVMHPANQLRRH